MGVSYFVLAAEEGTILHYILMVENSHQIGNLSKGQYISKTKCVILDSPKNRTLGHFSVHKNAPAFVFWENLGQHILFSRFTDL